MDSVYKVIEIIGSSPKSWEDAAKNAIETASKTVQDIRVAEIKEFDLKLEDGKVVAYRTKLNVSFKYQQ
jgi:flavin-binding protein dodecin